MVHYIDTEAVSCYSLTRPQISRNKYTGTLSLAWYVVIRALYFRLIIERVCLAEGDEAMSFFLEIVPVALDSSEIQLYSYVI